MQAAWCPGLISRSSGTIWRQSATAMGQRGWKTHPDGGFSGLGTSPPRTTCSRPGLHRRVRDGHRREQGLRVGVLGVLVERLPVRDLDDLAQIHHGHPVGDVAHHREVVGHEQVGQPELGLELLQQVDDLGLDRDVQRRDRLVADDQARLHGQRPGDADALALAARQLVRVPAGHGGQQARVAEQLVDPRGAGGPVRHDAVDGERLRDDLAHRHPRVERAVRVLEDDLHAPAHPAQLGVRELRHVPALEDHLAAGGRLEPEDGAAGGGLAAARLARPGPASRPGGSRSSRRPPPSRSRRGRRRGRRRSGSASRGCGLPELLLRCSTCCFVLFASSPFGLIARRANARSLRRG